MKFCLRTGFGESKEFFGGTVTDPILGYGQGSTAAPPLFSCLSSLIINAYKRMGNGANLTSFYAARIFLLAAAMYVDDTDLLYWGSSPTVYDDKLIAQVQKSTDDFSALAEASGGCLKPEKCFVYFLLYEARAGIMRMKSLRNLPPPTGNIEVKQADGSMKEEPCHLTVTQPGGDRVPIPTKDVTASTLMLGVHFDSKGDGTRHIKAMQQKGFEWADRLTTRPLPAIDAWLSFTIQLHKAMSYGLGAVIIPPKRLEKLMHALYYWILPILNVNRCITR